MPRKNTKDQILTIAREILASEGLASVSFDAIARRLGRTKQAVLYWYASKQELLAALFLPWLEAEAEVAVRSISVTTSRNEAVRAFVKAITDFHFADLDRFRMMYLLPQTIRQTGENPHNPEVLKKVHPVTDKMYDALAGKLDCDPLAARQEAFAMHSAALGLVLMFGLAESVGDPLKHTNSDLVAALIASLTSA